jgi:hypothetical protein
VVVVVVVDSAKATPALSSADAVTIEKRIFLIGDSILPDKWVFLAGGAATPIQIAT